MKILAKSRTLVADDAAFTPAVLRAEAERVWQLQQAGAVREIYFTAAGEAVLMLEAKDAAAARRLLATLPLVREKLIAFELDELRAYGGFARLFAPGPKPAAKRRRRP